LSTSSIPNTSERFNTNTTAKLTVEALKKHQVCIELFRERIYEFKEEASNRYKGLCPFHDDHNPSFSVYLDTDGNTWLCKCFAGCKIIEGDSGNIFQFIRQCDDVPFTEAVQTVREAAKNPDYIAKIKPKRPILVKPESKITLSLETIEKYEANLSKSETANKYLLKRGITQQTATRLHLGYRQDVGNLVTSELADKGWIVCPYIRGNEVYAIKYRSVADKAFTQAPGMHTTLFNTDTIDPNQPVYLVEGEFDAAIMEQAGFHAVSLPAASYRLTADDIAMLKASPVILAGDCDSIGSKAMELARNQIEGSRLLKWPEGMKDANQTFLEGCNGNLEAFQSLIHKLTAEAQATSAVTPAEFALTDSGNAERFATDHGANARFCHDFSAWMIWDGKHWRKDDTGYILRLAKQTARKMQEDALKIDNHKQREALVKHGLILESATRLTAMLKLAESELAIKPDEFDHDTMLFNCANGTLDLRTGKLREHRREDFIANLSPVEYHPGAECPVWLKFLRDITNGNAELMGYLQRCVGYSLTGETKEEVLFLLYGSGNNGKTKFIEAVRYLLGTYAQTSDFDTFTVNFKNGGAARNDIAKLRGARFVTASESDDGKRLNESIVKQITGGDMLSARFLYGELFEYKPLFKLWLATNHKPQIRGNDEGIWRRIHQVPFTVYIPEKKRDRDLDKKLKTEASGILRWAIEGLADYQSGGLQIPQIVREATAEYREDQDILGQFIADECIIDPKLKVQSSVIYDCYKRWTNTNEYFTLNLRGFKQAMEGRPGIEFKPTAKANFWQGISLRQDRCDVFR